MFIIDKLLAAPVHGLLWIARKIRQRADEELADDEPGIRARLAELNRQIEAGLIDEQTFVRKEAALIDRLEVIWADQQAESLAGMHGLTDMMTSDDPAAGLEDDAVPDDAEQPGDAQRGQQATTTGG